MRDFTQNNSLKRRQTNFVFMPEINFEIEVFIGA